MLASLALRPNTVVTGSQLIDEVWGDDPPRSATKTLQTYISHLRRALDGAPIERLGAGYRLLVEPDDVDATRFERLVDQAHARGVADPDAAARLLDEALALWRGEALAEFIDLDFARAQATRLTELKLRAVEDRIDLGLELDEAGRLVGQLQGLVRQYPLRERFWGQLMVALDRSGRRADALRTFKQAREALIDSAGVEPGEELRSLERALLGGDAPTRPGDQRRPHATVSAPDRPPIPPALARNQAIRGRELAMAGALGTPAPLVFITGEPGIGKTRFLAELAASHHASGGTVVYGRCDEDPVIPFQPFYEAIRPLLDPSAESAGDLALARLPISGRDTGPPANAEMERFRMFEAMMEILRKEAARHDLLILLDDLHWADRPTVLLLLHLLRAAPGTGTVPGSGGFRIVASYRDTDLAPTTALGASLGGLLAAASSERISLGGVDGDAVRAMLAERLTANIDEGLVERIRWETQGNPLFVGLMADHLAEVGESGIPERGRDVIGQRLGRLPAATQDLLRVAAVIGHEFSLGTLAAAAGSSPAAALDDLEPAITAGVIIEAVESVERFRFRHALLQATVFDGLGPSRRARLHLAVAEAIETIGEPGGERQTELARHFGAAAAIGALPKAITYARLAGQRALDELAYEDAVRWFEQAVELLGKDPAATTEARGWALVELSDALFRAADYGRSHRCAHDAAALGRTAGSRELVATAALGWSGAVVHLPGNVDERWQLLEDALAAPPDDPALRARLLARKVGSDYLSRPSEELLPLLEESLRLGAGSSDPEVIVDLAVMLSNADLDLLDCEELEATIARLISVGEALESVWARGGPHHTMMMLYLRRGDGAGARAMHRLYQDGVAALQVTFYQAIATFLEATWAVIEGRFDDAQQAIDTAYGLGALYDDNAVAALAAYASQMVAMRWAQGRLDELDNMIEAQLSMLPELDAWRAVLAVAHLHAGRPDQAREILDQFRRAHPERIVVNGMWSSIVSGLAEVIAGLDDAEAARWLYPQVEPRRESMAVLAPNLFVGDFQHVLGLLAVTMGDNSRAVTHLRRSVDRLTALGATPFVLKARHTLARALVAAGDPEAGAVEAAAAAAAATALGITLH